MAENEEILRIVLEVEDEASKVLAKVAETTVEAAEDSVKALDGVEDKVNEVGDAVEKVAEEDVPKMGKSMVKISVFAKKGMQVAQGAVQQLGAELAAADAQVAGIAQSFVSSFGRGGLITGGILFTAGILKQIFAEERERQRKQEEWTRDHHTRIRETHELELEYLDALKGESKSLWEEVIAAREVAKEASLALAGEEYSAQASLQERAHNERLRQIDEQAAAIQKREADLQMEAKFGGYPLAEVATQEIEVVQEQYGELMRLRNKEEARFAAEQEARAATREKRRNDEISAEEKRLDSLRRGEIAKADALFDSEKQRVNTLQETQLIRLRVLGMTEEEQKYQAQILEIEDLRRSGLETEARTAEMILRIEQARSKEAEDQVKAKQKQETAKEATKRVNDQLRAMREEARYGKELATLRARMTDLLKQGAEASQVNLLYQTELAEVQDRENQQKEEYLADLQKQVEFMSLATVEAQEQFDIQERLNEARESGGQEAVQLLERLIALEKERTQEQEKQSEELQEQAKEQQQLQRLMAGGHMDKGLRSRRDERRARLHMRKRRREQNQRTGLSLDESIGIQTPGAEGLGPMSDWQAPGESTGAGSPLGTDPLQLAGGMKSVGESLDRTAQELKATDEILVAANETGDKMVESAKSMGQGVLDLAVGVQDLTSEIFTTAEALSGTVLTLGTEIGTVKADLVALRRELEEAERLAAG